MKYAPPIGQEAEGENAHYIDGNPELGILGSPVPAAALEPVQRELVHVIREAGLDPTGDDLTQLWQAICKVIGIKAPLATLLRAGLMHPDGVTTTVDDDGLLSALGGNLLLNSKQWITASGTFEAPVDSWYDVLAVDGGNGGSVYLDNNTANGGRGGAHKHAFIYLRQGQQISIIIGSGGLGLAYNTGASTLPIAGGITSVGDVDFGIYASSDYGSMSIYRHPNAPALACGSGPGGAELPSHNGRWYGAGGAAYLPYGSGVPTAAQAEVSNGAPGIVLFRWHDRAKAAGRAPALLSVADAGQGEAAAIGEAPAAQPANAPATVNLYDPETGMGSVWREEDAEAKLAEGFITQEAWLEICAQKGAEAYAAWLADPKTEAVRFELLRQARDAKLAEHDVQVVQLQRQARAGADVADDLAAWDAYAVALCDLPAQAGAPWDGGGEATPWPVEPVVTKVQEA